MALDRPATPPDRPETSPASDAPSLSDEPPVSGAPDNSQAPEVPAELRGVESLTRAQAFESLRAQVAGAAADTPSTGQPDRPHGYWDEVPRLESVWNEIAERFPAEHEVAEHTAPNGGETERPERRMALDQIADCEPSVSADMKSIEAETQTGASLIGFEFRLKSMERLSEKVTERIMREPERDPESILRTVHDAIRYTFCIPRESYSAGCEEIKSQLESRGYEMYHRRNSWLDPEYKGLNTRWVTPAGQRFEVQFHTEESFHAKHDVTHKAYERLRQPDVSSAERQELMDFQKLVSSKVPVPEGTENLSDFDKDI